MEYQDEHIRCWNISLFISWLKTVIYRRRDWKLNTDIYFQKILFSKKCFLNCIGIAEKHFLPWMNAFKARFTESTSADQLKICRSLQNNQQYWSWIFNLSKTDDFQIYRPFHKISLPSNKVIVVFVNLTSISLQLTLTFHRCSAIKKIDYSEILKKFQVLAQIVNKNYRPLKVAYRKKKLNQ